jgi:hypothetical protein
MRLGMRFALMLREKTAKKGDLFRFFQIWNRLLLRSLNLGMLFCGNW